MPESKALNHAWLLSLSQSTWAPVTKPHRLGGYCISHSSGSWKVQDQGTSRFGVWCGLCSRLADGCLLAVLSYGGVVRCPGLFLFLQEHCSLPSVSPIMTSPKPTSSQRPHLQILSHWALGLQHRNFRGICKHSVHSTTDKLCDHRHILLSQYDCPFCTRKEMERKFSISKL